MNAKPFEGKRVLVTGGTGSMGKAFIERLLRGADGLPQQIIVFSRDEAKQHYMRLSYMRREFATDEIIYHQLRETLSFQIGDVRSYEDVRRAIRGVNIVVNAAALKQVPTCEYFPEQAISTNCLGAMNIVKAVTDGHGAPETVVGVSTDKACKPVNVMGMTKAIQERIFACGNLYSEETKFIGVRYGNVLASRGSVLPLFMDQLERGGPLTITHPEMTRFLLPLSGAVETVCAAINDGDRGEIFCPRIPSARMTDLAAAMIGGRDVEMKITGVRPGEKLHEVLVSEEEVPRTVKRGGYYVIRAILPEVAGTVHPGAGDEDYDLGGEYSSRDHTMDQAGVAALLEANGLLKGSTRSAVFV